MKKTSHSRLPTVFLVDGSTGAGKSTLMGFLRRNYGKLISVGAKFTERPRRVTDGDWEFQFVDTISPDLDRYSYLSVGRRYALDIVSLRNTLASGLSYAVSCTDPHTIRAIRRAFPTVVILVYREVSAARILSLSQSREGASESDIVCRLMESACTLTHYAENIGIYDYVVLNTGEVLDLERQTAALLRECGIAPGPIRDSSRTQTPGR